MTLDPTEYEISELGPKVNQIDDVEELEAILEAEEAGDDRGPVKTLVQSRIDSLTEEEEPAPDEVDPDELTLAELGNIVRKIDEVEELEAILAAERDGKDRSGAADLIENRIDSITQDEDEGEQVIQSPEEKHPHLDHPTADKKHVRALEDGTYKDMWVYLETQQGILLDVSKEMLGKARELMDGYNEQYDTDEDVVAVLIGHEITDLAEQAIEYGADRVLVYDDERLARFQNRPYTEIFCDMGRSEADWKDYDEPRYTIFPATHNGRDLSALVQGEFDSGLASDCSDLFIDEPLISNPAKTGAPGEQIRFERVLHMKRPDFSGFEYSTILCLDNPEREFHPQGASVIPGSFPIPDSDPAREGEIIEYDIELDEDWFIVEITDFDVLEPGVDITGHEVVVCIGRGIGDDPTGGIELALDLVDAFDNAELGLTRGIVTASYQVDGHVEQYVTEERQIGETGVVVEPDLYIAAGVSGAVQHKVGMDESETIVAINTDSDARIKDFSDYYIEGDLFEVLPRLTEAVESTDADPETILTEDD